MCRLGSGKWLGRLRSVVSLAAESLPGWPTASISSVLCAFTWFQQHAVRAAFHVTKCMDPAWLHWPDFEHFVLSSTAPRWCVGPRVPLLGAPGLVQCDSHGSPFEALLCSLQLRVVTHLGLLRGPWLHSLLVWHSCTHVAAAYERCWLCACSSLPSWL